MLRAFLALVSTAMPLLLAAQTYLLDDHRVDSVELYTVTASKQHSAELPDKAAFKLPIGRTVEVERTLRGNPEYGLVKIEGRRYAVNSRYLLFSDENPEGTADLFGDTRSRKNHRPEAKWFGSPAPYYIMGGCIVAAVVLLLLGRRFDPLRRPALVLAPLLMIVGSLLEARALHVLGDGAFWWCSPDRLGFWLSLLYLVPFGAFALGQCMSIFIYESLLLRYRPETEISIKPTAIGMAICIPATLIAAAAMALAGIKGTVMDTVALTVFAGSLGVGILLAACRNVRALGAIGGLAFTLFSIVYLLGLLTTVYGIFLIVWEMLFQLLLLIPVLGLLASGGNIAPSAGSSSASSAPESYRAADGKTYRTQDEAIFASNQHYQRQRDKSGSIW